MMAMADSSTTVVGESLPENTLQRYITESTGTFSLETNYQQVKAMGVGEFVSSRLFRVGGYDWDIMFYPNGPSADCASAFLRCASRGKNTSAKFTLTLLGKEGQAPVATGELDQVFCLEKPGPDNPTEWGFQKFAEKSKLKSLSRHGGDGAFTIRCTLTVRNESMPLELPGHLERMLLDGTSTDVTFVVGDRKFRAHRSLLAARSREFCKQFSGPTVEKDMPHVNEVVDDVEPTIFEMLLHYVYTDSLPRCQDEGGYHVAVMQHLMVAAVKYEMERLRLMCEEQLCHMINLDTIKSMFALANKHNCKQLKDACVTFMASPEVLGALLETCEFKEHFMKNCRPLPLDGGASTTKGSHQEEVVPN